LRVSILGRCEKVKRLIEGDVKDAGSSRIVASTAELMIQFSSLGNISASAATVVSNSFPFKVSVAVVRDLNS